MLGRRELGRDASICAFCRYRLALRLSLPRHRTFSRTRRLAADDRATPNEDVTSPRKVVGALLPRRPVAPLGGGGWGKPAFVNRPQVSPADIPGVKDSTGAEKQNSAATAQPEIVLSEHELSVRAQMLARQNVTRPKTNPPPMSRPETRTTPILRPGMRTIPTSRPNYFLDRDRKPTSQESTNAVPSSSDTSAFSFPRRDPKPIMRQQFEKVSRRDIGPLKVSSLTEAPADKPFGLPSSRPSLSNLLRSSMSSSNEPRRLETVQKTPQASQNTSSTTSNKISGKWGQWGGGIRTTRSTSPEQGDHAQTQPQAVPLKQVTLGSNAIRPIGTSEWGNNETLPIIRGPRRPLQDNKIYSEQDKKIYPEKDNKIYPENSRTPNDRSPTQQPETKVSKPSNNGPKENNSWGLLSRKAAPDKIDSEGFWNTVSEKLNVGISSKPKLPADWGKEFDREIEYRTSKSATETETVSPILEVEDILDAIPEAPSSAAKKLRRAEIFELNPEESNASKGRDKRDVQGSFEDKRGRKDRGKSKKSGRRSRYEDDEFYEEDTAFERYEEKRRSKAERKAQKEAELAVPISIHLPELISIMALADALKVKHHVFLQQLGELGFEGVTLDSLMAGETAALVAQEYGFEPVVDVGSSRDLKPRPPPEDLSSVPLRPPVVTIMGHVDHGKTTLLDYLRKSSITAQEHGGITQHIGAFSVRLSTGKLITFLDTPGHAAFLKMRERGAQVTDIIILVVAADDSVKPQTLEALNHARAHKVPIIVAINKIDKDATRIDQVKADLGRYDVEIEEFGGDVQVVLVSGKTGQGMDELEDNILTLSEILDIRAETDGAAEGWVLESSLKQIGKTATVLVKRGTLRPGDYIVAGLTWAKIRNMRNEAGVTVSEAPPGTAVEILGWRDMPAAGDQVIQGADENSVKEAVNYREGLHEREKDAIDHEAIAEGRRQHQERRVREKAILEESGIRTPVGGNWNSRKASQYLQAKQQAAEAVAAAGETEDGDGQEGEQQLEGTSSATKIVNFVVKGDVHGSVEAVCAAIQELGNHEVRPRVLRSAPGPPTESDIELAAASDSVLVGFATPPLTGQIRRMAENNGIRVIEQNIIYRLIDDVNALLSEHLAPEITIRVLGDAEVLEIFPINVKARQYKNVAGCRVRTGSITRGALYRVLRGGEKIFDGKLETLKQTKKDVTEMHKGSECGIGFEDFQDFQVGDVIQAYKEIRTDRTLQ